MVQASEHLRILNMRNMVMKYCRRVQPEWKKQVHCWPIAQNFINHKVIDYYSALGFFFPVAGAESCSQWDLQRSERRLPSECWQAVFGLQAWYVFLNTFIIYAHTKHHTSDIPETCTINRGFPIALYRTWANQSQSHPDSWKWQSAGGT